MMPVNPFSAAALAIAALAGIAAVLWIAVITLGRKIPHRRNSAWQLLIQSVVTCVVPYTLIAFGQQSVDSALAAILRCLSCRPTILARRSRPLTARTKI